MTSRLLDELCAVLKQQGWSQSDWSRASGVAPGVISRMLRGQRQITVPTLERLVKPFGRRVALVEDDHGEEADAKQGA